MKIKYRFLLYILVLFLISVASEVRAQDLTREESVAQAILDMTTTPQRNLWWRPCGERFRGRHPDAEVYARSIADVIVEEAQTDLDPWWMAAQLMQESGMNPCAFSSNEFNVLRRSLGREPTQRDILRLLRSSRVRQEHGIRAMDGGLAQFRWPGPVARQAGIEEPEQLLDTRMSIHAFASALRRYREYCTDFPVFSGIDTVPIRGTDRSRVIRWSYRCEDTFWAIHNSGFPGRVRRRYIRNVQRRYRAGPEVWRARFFGAQPPEERPAG